MNEHRDRAMQCLKNAATFEKHKKPLAAFAFRKHAAYWFRKAAKQTPWVKPIG